MEACEKLIVAADDSGSGWLTSVSSHVHCTNGRPRIFGAQGAVLRKGIGMDRYAGIAASFGATIAFAGVALADGLPGSVKDAKPAEGRTLGYSWNIGATSDYVFRGVSQNAGKAAFQGGVDITYGIFYAGVWGSDVNFGRNSDGLPFGSGNQGSAIANVEIDVYAGIKPVLGPVTFDLGVITYNYVGGHDKGPRFLQAREQDFQEVKLGASASFFPKLTTGVTLFYSPSFQQGQGSVYTLEGTAAYELPTVAKVVPTLSGTVGSQFGDAGSTTHPYTFANGKDSYVYWNAGLGLAFDKLSVDLRYWDTNIPNTPITAAGTGFCAAQLFGCDGRFVGTVKVTF